MPTFIVLMIRTTRLVTFTIQEMSKSLQGRHNERDDVSNHRRLDCLPNRFFRRRSKSENINAPRHWPLCEDFTGDRWIHAQRASNAEKVSIWWRHHVVLKVNTQPIVLLYCNRLRFLWTFDLAIMTLIHLACDWGYELAMVEDWWLTLHGNAHTQTVPNIALYYTNTIATNSANNTRCFVISRGTQSE